MIDIRNPPGTPAPVAYHHGMEVSGDVRTLYVAGQIGVGADGEVPAGIEAQARLVYANLNAVLAAAGMDVSNLVKTTVFLVDRADREAFAAIRAEAMGGHKTASTLVFVSGLASPALLVEVEGVAVAPRSAGRG